jgi:DNA-binding FadR family transcriptional regulator
MNTTVAAGPTFARVRVRRGFEHVCQQIREGVAQGHLAPGDRLPHETLLAEQLDVSRNAVRQALRSLELAGVVEIQTGVRGGFFIRSGSSEGLTQAVRDMVSLSQVDARDVTEARLHLTRVAIELACKRATQEDLDAIEAEIDGFEKLVATGKPTRATPAVTDFYRVLAEATHNKVIVMLVESLSELMRGMLADIDMKISEGVVKVRRKVLRHLREGDAQKATAAMARHQQALNAYIEEHQPKRRVP